MTHPNLFKAFDKTGRAWLRAIPSEDRKAFAFIGLDALGRFKFAHIGGKARAKTAKRDSKGRFLKSQGASTC